ncbi:hypothetical protein [Nocardia sp. CS682]|uniref:hypothetical protein n=1 Tax=Nocardia sp. CS682 TaxID=1047172 RepID=UPI0014305DFE|nr:hypothetical protein [Nocardia sp. CS682]
MDDRWKGIATVPRSVAADSLLDFGVLFESSEPTEQRVVLRGDIEPAEQAPEGEAG